MAIVTKDKKYYSWVPLKYWEEKLKKYGFCRCHRGYIVNIAKISMISPWFRNTYNIKIKEIPDVVHLSKTYAKSFMKFIKA